MHIKICGFVTDINKYNQNGSDAVMKIEKLSEKLRLMILRSLIHVFHDLRLMRNMTRMILVMTLKISVT